MAAPKRLFISLAGTSSYLDYRTLDESNKLEAMNSNMQFPIIFLFIAGVLTEQRS